MPKLSDQVSVRIDPGWKETLKEIEEKHRIPPPELVRGLMGAALDFYREHGWFGFPVVVVPMSEYVQAVAETQSRYVAAPPPAAKSKKPPAKN